jgi:hypothetical protein
MDWNNHSITLTFGDQAENHKGMQIIGQMAETGFDLEDFNQEKFYSIKVEDKVVPGGSQDQRP